MYTCKEVAELLSLSTMTVWRMARDGRIPCVRIGKVIRFNKEDIDYIMDGGTGSAKWVREGSSTDDEMDMV